MHGNLLLNIIKTTEPKKIPVALTRVQMDLTVSQAMSQEHQISFLKKDDPMQLEMLISMMVSLLADQFNVKASFNDIQIVDCTLSIIKKYWYLRPEEILYAFKQAKMGVYGSAYNKLDTPTILEWLHKYDTEDRMSNVERTQQDFKKSDESFDVNHAYGKEIAFQSVHGISSIAKASRDKKEAKAKEIQNEAGFQAFQEEYNKNKKAPSE